MGEASSKTCSAVVFHNKEFQAIAKFFDLPSFFVCVWQKFTLTRGQII